MRRTSHGGPTPENVTRDVSRMRPCVSVVTPMLFGGNVSVCSAEPVAWSSCTTVPLPKLLAQMRPARSNVGGYATLVIGSA